MSDTEYDFSPKGITGYLEQYVGTVLTSVTPGTSEEGDWIVGVVNANNEPDTIALSGASEAAAFLSGMGVASHAILRRVERHTRED